MDGNDHDYLRGSLSASVLEFFRDYGVDCSVDPSAAPSTAPPPSGDFELGSIVGFKGAHLRGGLAFVAPVALVAKMLPVPHDAERAEIQLRDWSGEMANQLAGRLKNKLSARALDFDVGTVACFRGVSLRLEFLPAADALSMCFTIASTGVRIYLDCSIVPGALRAASTRPVVPEGGVVVF
jgi:CheY-specific phosphatase CheX